MEQRVNEPSPYAVLKRLKGFAVTPIVLSRMFAHSYDPLGFEHQLQLSPSPDEKRRRQERSRRRRMIEADRRRQEKMDRMLLADEVTYRMHPGGEFRRHCSEPSLQYFRRDEGPQLPPTASLSPMSNRHSPSFEMDDPLVGNIPVPPFIYARSVSASMDDMDRDIENHSPSRAIDSRARRGCCGDADPMSSSSAVLRENAELKSQASGNGPNKEAEPPKIDIDDDDCDDPVAPPHIIAKEDTSDDEDEDADDLYTVWRPR